MLNPGCSKDKDSKIMNLWCFLIKLIPRITKKVLMWAKYCSTTNVPYQSSCVNSNIYTG